MHLSLVKLGKLGLNFFIRIAATEKGQAANGINSAHLNCTSRHLGKCDGFSEPKSTGQDCHSFSRTMFFTF